MRLTDPWRQRAARIGFSLLSTLLALTCAAQSGPDDDADTVAADPPGRVGRVSIVAGSATVTDMTSGDSQTVLLNWPITGGQNIATDAGGRAEIRIGSLAVRLDGATDVDFVRIDDETIELVVQRGAVGLHVRSRDMLAAIDLTTPRERVVLDDVGRYRLDVDRAPGLTSLTVTTGYARLLTDGSTFSVVGGQRADISGEPAPQVQILAPLTDNFGDWVAPLDRRDDAIRSARYLSTETTGIESLDDFGQWRSVADYGQVWFPAVVQASWVPYRFGRWIWVVPWGWTWVDEAPWGFAPFHYGRWVSLNGRWGWLPGAYVTRPIYAPCLVAWYGGAGPVGWFPLGPGDIYVPGYRASRHYVETLNFQHLRGGSAAWRGDSQPRYVYQRNPNVVTWVDTDTMAHHRPVGRALQPPPPQWSAAPATHLAPVAAQPPRAIKRGADEVVASPAIAPARPATVQPTYGQSNRPARVDAAPALGVAASQSSPARRPPSPLPPTIGGEPGRRGQPVQRPIRHPDRPAVPIQPVPAAPPIQPTPAAAPQVAAPAAGASQPIRAPEVRVPQHPAAEHPANVEADRSRAVPH